MEANEPRPAGRLFNPTGDRKPLRGPSDEEILAAAMRVDPYTATMVWWWGDIMDPYSRFAHDPGWNSGRLYFLDDPGVELLVEEWDVRVQHPEISEERWRELMFAAAARDESRDPFPMFHKYRRGPFRWPPPGMYPGEGGRQP